MSERVESSLGLRFQGCSTNSDIGNKINDPQINIEAVTFSFSLLLIFNVSKPPIT